MEAPTIVEHADSTGVKHSLSGTNELEVSPMVLVAVRVILVVSFVVESKVAMLVGTPSSVFLGGAGSWAGITMIYGSVECAECPKCFERRDTGDFRNLMCCVQDTVGDCSGRKGICKHTSMAFCNNTQHWPAPGLALVVEYKGTDSPLSGGKSLNMCR